MSEFDFGSEGAPSVPFDFENSVVSTVPADVAAERAKKYNYALGPSSPGTDNLVSQILTGTEDQERQRQATLGMLQNEQRKTQIINTLSAKGRMDESTKQLVLGMSAQDLQDPASYLEKKYAEKVTTDAMAMPAIVQSAIVQARLENEPKAFDTADYFTKQIFFKENIQHKLEELSARLDKTPWLTTSGPENQSRIGAKLEQFGVIPFLYNARMYSSPEIPDGSYISGKDLKAQIDYYQSLPDQAQAVAEVKARAEEIYSKNPYAALEFLHAFMSFTDAQQQMKNLETGIDASIIGSLVKSPVVGAVKALRGIRAAEGEGRLSNLLSDVSKAVNRNPTKASDVFEATGDMNAAALARRQENIETGLKATGKAADFSELRGQTISLENAEETMKGSTALSREATRRLEMQAARDQQRALDVIAQGGKIERLPEGSLAYERGLTETEVANRYYPNLGDVILDIQPSRSLANTLHVVTEFGERKFAPSSTDAITLREAANGAQERTLLSLEAANDIDNRIAVAQRQKDDLTQRWLNSQSAGNKKLESSFRAQLDKVKAQLDKLEAQKLVKGEIGSSAKANTRPPFNQETLKAGNDNITVTLGNREATTFDTRERANYFATEEYGFKKNGYWVEPKGNGWVIKTSKAVDETLPSVRDALAIETENSVRKDLGSYLLQGRAGVNLRGTESTLPKELVNSFKSAGYGSKEQIKAVDVMAQDIKALRSGRKEQWQDFQKFIEYQRTKENPDTGRIGEFSRNQGQFEQDFFTNRGKLPTEAQSSAYWSYIRISDLDWVVRNLGIYRDKVRKGLENFGFPVEGIGNLEASIEGKQLRDMLPHNGEFPTDYVVWNKNGTLNKFNSSNNSKYQEYRAKVLSGEYKAVQLSPTGREQFRDPRVNPHYQAIPKFVDVVLTEDLDRAPLGLQQIPNRPGGHIAYDMQWYASQPDIGRGPLRRNLYKGDINFYGFDTETFGRRQVAAINEARVMLKEAVATGDYRALEAFLPKNLPHTVEDLKSMFKGYGKGGTADIDTPILLRPNHLNTFEMEHKPVGGKKQNLQDVLGLDNLTKASDDPHNLYDGINLKYATERGDLLNTIVRDGSKDQPLYNFRPAKLLDPIQTMERSAKSLLRDRYFDDLKYKTAERFQAEFGGLLEKRSENPYENLVNPQWGKGVDKYSMAAAMDYRRSALELLGVKTEWQSSIDYLKNKMADSLYESFGERAKPLIDKVFLSNVRSPIDYARTVAFQEKLGLFNPKQFLVQATGAFQVAAIAGPERAVKAFPISQVMNALTWTSSKEIVEHFATNIAPKLGMVREHFLEMYAAYKDSGFYRSGREQAIRDWTDAPGLTTPLGKFADWGASPFNRGEEISRAMGYATSYQQWREANPTAKFTNQRQQDVLGRADTLTGNQSGVSAAMWQKVPVVSNIAQFWNSQMRLAGLLWGRDLTDVEKIRMLLGTTIFTGAPIAASAYTLYPWYSQMRSDMEAKGVDPNTSWISRFFFKGGLNQLAEWVTGTEMTTSETFGQQGLSLLYRPWDKKWMDLMGGASGTTIGDNLKSLAPLFEETINGRPLKWEDFKDILSNVSTANSFFKAQMAIETNKYLSKTGISVDKVTGWQGIFMALTGTNLESAARAYGQISDMKQMDAYQASMKQEYNKDFRRAYQAKDSGDDKGFEDFMARANAHFELSGAKPFDKKLWVQEASQLNQSLVSRVAQKYAERMMHQKPSTGQKLLGAEPSGRAAYDLYLKRKDNGQSQ